MNDVAPGVDTTGETLADAQKQNVTAAHRNVGLVVETRPDLVTQEELAWYRTLGVDEGANGRAEHG